MAELILSLGGIRIDQDQFVSILKEHPEDIIYLWLDTAKAYSQALDSKDVELDKVYAALLKERIKNLKLSYRGGNIKVFFDSNIEILARDQLRSEGFNIP